MNKYLEILRICDMLRTLNVLDETKNSREDIKEVLDFIADKLEEIVGDYNGKVSKTTIF